jgi:hypothetical protein
VAAVHAKTVHVKPHFKDFVAIDRDLLTIALSLCAWLAVRHSDCVNGRLDLSLVFIG